MLQTSTVYYYLILFHMMSSVLQGNPLFLHYNVLHSLPFVYFPFFFIFVKMGSHDCFSQNPKTGSDGFPWTKSTEPQKRFP